MSLAPAHLTATTPPVPKFILRGHASTVHALSFCAQNAYLLSGDAEGWLVLWSLATKRAAAVWKGHEGGILGVKEWRGSHGEESGSGGEEFRIITHGRDHTLRVWRVEMGELDGMVMSVRLPVDGAEEGTSRKPWLLHAMAVNALNFCAFAICDARRWDGVDLRTCDGEGKLHEDEIGHRDLGDDVSQEVYEEQNYRPVLIASPNALDQGGIDIFQLPSEIRRCKLAEDKDFKTGMVMALAIFYHPTSGGLVLIAGYEDGSTIVQVRDSLQTAKQSWNWRKTLVSCPHVQPVLSLAVHPSVEVYFTSSADAMIAKFAIPALAVQGKLINDAASAVNTKHAGQQGVEVRSDGKIFATAGWDARVRVYSAKTMKELAVLKWHKESLYALAFAEVGAAQSSTQRAQDSTSKNDDRTGTARDGVRGVPASALDLIKQERSTSAQTMHWLAAAGKEGKISLWDVY